MNTLIRRTLADIHGAVDEHAPDMYVNHPAAGRYANITCSIGKVKSHR